MRRAEADLRAGRMERHCKTRLAEALMVVGANRASRERMVRCARCRYLANDLMHLQRHGRETHGVELDETPCTVTKQEDI